MFLLTLLFAFLTPRFYDNLCLTIVTIINMALRTLIPRRTDTEFPSENLNADRRNSLPRSEIVKLDSATLRTFLRTL